MPHSRRCGRPSPNVPFREDRVSGDPRERERRTPRNAACDPALCVRNARRQAAGSGTPSADGKIVIQTPAKITKGEIA